MKNIKEIIAENLISLRKKSGLTQNELAEKLNYSDNTISRWEHAEITPSIETLEQIANIYNVPIEYLIKQNALKNIETDTRTLKIKKLVTILLCVSIVWFVAVITFFYCNLLWEKYYWTIYVWAVPVSCLVLLTFTKYINNRIYGFVFSTITIWSLLASIYLQCLQYNLYLIFIIGVPVQLALSVYTFIRPQEKHKK